MTALLGLAACGTVGSLATPTLVPEFEPVPTSTPTFTDLAKAEITELFNNEVSFLNGGEWEAAYAICSPDYRTRRSESRFENDVTQVLSRYDVSPTTLDARNVTVTKGRDDRFDLSYDSYIDGRFSQNVSVGGAYVYVNGVWYDDGALCR